MYNEKKPAVVDNPGTLARRVRHQAADFVLPCVVPSAPPRTWPLSLHLGALLCCLVQRLFLLHFGDCLVSLCLTL